MSSDEPYLADLHKALARVVEIAAEEGPRTATQTDALAMTLLVIGEAAKKLSLSFKQAHPGTPWAQIIGLRHKLAHHYFLTDADRLWKIAEEDAPALLASLPSRPAPPTPAA